MMSRLAAPAAASLLLCVASPSAAQQPAPRIVRPDLTITSVSSANLDSGIIQVAVKNAGNATAPAAVIRVVLNGPQTLAQNFPQPSVAPGQTVVFNVPTGKSLPLVSYAMRTDGLGAITESNENNNVVTGKFEGKP